MKTHQTLRMLTRSVLLLSTFTTFYVVQLSTALAQGTAFTYQGQLVDGGFYANGFYDLEFTLYNDAVSGSALGVLTNTATEVTDGLFTVSLDFGSGVFDGSDRWLEIGAVTNGGGAFSILSPRQAITATPYALLSAGVSGSVSASQLTGSISASNIGADSITSVMLADGAVGTDQLAAGSVFTGTFSGDGSGVTGVNLESLNSQGAIMGVTNIGVFSLSSSPGVGAYPHSVTSADVNGDGWADLISANYGADTLTVLTNNTNGGFALSSSPSVGTNPDSVTSADVNGDGWTDLISANVYADSLTVLTNNGSGGFALSSSPSVGAYPYSVTSADVNGDSWVDLISASFVDSTVTVLTNNGSGGFVLSSSPGVGDNPYSVTSADVNGDGWVDLISANYWGDTVTVLTNNGSGGFVLSSSPGAGSRPRSVTSADVNGDGKPDLITANYTTDTLTVLTNNGSGGFALSSSPAVGDSPISVTSADVNGDGWADLVSANSFDDTLTVLTNNTSGGFALSSSPGVGTTPSSVTSADVNGDGWADLISANNGDDTLTVLINASTIDGFSFTGSFSGDGANLIGLNASELTSGTVDDARLSANVAKLNTSQTFTGANTFNSAGNSFTGNGAGLTGLPNGHSLDASDGSPANALYVDADGDVGIGTTTPSGDLQIQTPNSVNASFRMRSGTGWYLVMNQSPSSVFSISNGGQERFTIDPGGDVGIGTASPSEKLHVVGNIYATGTITPSSDRNLKKNFNPVNALEVLERVSSLPIHQWTYKAEADAVRHVGPMAQDFHAAFGYGANDVTIATVDADGVALAAIQGLNEKMEAGSRQTEDSIHELKAENAALRVRLEKLERLLNSTLEGSSL